MLGRKGSKTSPACCLSLVATDKSQTISQDRVDLLRVCRVCFKVVAEATSDTCGAATVSETDLG